MAIDEYHPLTPEALIRRVRRRARKRYPRVNRWVRLAVLDAFDWRCAYCGCELTEGEPTDNQKMATMDHVIPKSKGGTNAKENLKPACPDCNCEKGDTIEENVNPDPTPGAEGA